MWKLAAAALVTVGLSGCGSVLNFAEAGPTVCGPAKIQPFGGVANDLVGCVAFPPAAPLCIVDLPASLAVDLLTLPITIPVSQSRR